MKEMILPLAAVLAMTSVTYADFSCSSVRTGQIGSVLDVYLVSVGGVKTFANLTISCPVHQVNMFWGFPSKAMTTLFTDTLPPGPNYMDADTHFMFETPSLQTPGSNFSDDETNDKSNPAGLVDVNGYGFKYGYGTFNCAGDGFALTSELAPGTPFMQIVLPHGISYCSVEFDTVVNGNAMHVKLGPEPSTVLMLFFGGLCLLVFRFRKHIRHGGIS
jgi:hypothetical protein